MLQVREITVYACKSARKNAKCNTKTIKAYRGYDNLKKRFTPDDLADLIQWMSLQDYGYFNIVVYADNICLHPFNNHHYSEYQALTVYREFAKLFNLEVVE